MNWTAILAEFDAITASGLAPYEQMQALRALCAQHNVEPEMLLAELDHRADLAFRASERENAADIYPAILVEA